MTRPCYDGNALAWNEVYRSSDPFGQRIQRRRDAVLSLVGKRLGVKTARILDAGCGTGEVARRLKAMGHMVVGVELSSEMLQEASRPAPGMGLVPAYVRGTVLGLPFSSQTFDVVICVGVMEHLTRRRVASRVIDAETDAIQELLRVAKPDGLLIVTGANLMRLHWLLDPKRLWGALTRKWRDRRLGEEEAERGGNLQTTTFPGAEPLYTHYRTPREMRRFLAAQGLEILDWTGIGFGPFTFFGHHLFSFDRSVRMSVKLEKMTRHSPLGPLTLFASTWLLALASRTPPGDQANAPHGSRGSLP